MICKKCGATIADTSKFCGYCGNAVVEESIVDSVEEVSTNNNETIDLDQSLMHEDEQVDSLAENQQPIVNESVSLNSGIEGVDVSPKLEVSSNNFNEEVPKIDEGVHQVENTSIFEQSQMNNTVNTNTIENIGQSFNVDTTTNNNLNSGVNASNVNNGNNNNDKVKKASPTFLIVGGVFILIGIICVVTALLIKNRKVNSIESLEKAVANFTEKAQNSGKILVSASVTSSDAAAINLSAFLKYSKVTDGYNVQFNLAKSLFTDEINVYAALNKSNALLYVKSSVIDLLGTTSSDEDKWLSVSTSDLGLELNFDDTKGILNKVSVNEIIDENHFRYIDSKGNLNHFQLTIDKELIDKINAKLGENKLAENLIETAENNNYVLDVYITTSNELKKISMDLTKLIDSEDVKGAVIAVEFDSLGNDTVEIPTDAKKATISVSEYVETNSSFDTSLEENSDKFDVSEDYSFEY